MIKRHVGTEPSRVASKPRLAHRIEGGDFASETMRIGDLDGDGIPDLLLVQNNFESREITCLTAMTMDGRRLWQSGTPSHKNGVIFCDLPVQIYDWDGDGRNEVLWIEHAIYAEAVIGLYDGFKTQIVPQAEMGPFNALRGQRKWYCEHAKRYEGTGTLHVLDGATGREKATIPLPAGADDCMLIANLTGSDRRQDLVVKDRYWNMWGVAHDGTVLWKWQGSTGHYPVIADVDGDGRDEVFVGYALIDHDGSEFFSHEVPAPGVHQDASYVTRLANGEWRLLFGNHGVHCLNTTGRELWHHPLREAQHVVVRRFRDDSEQQVLVVDRGAPTDGGGRLPATLLLYDIDGREIWRREQAPGSWCTAAVDIDWLGGGAPYCFATYNQGTTGKSLIYDGNGDIIAELPFTLGRSEGDKADVPFSIIAGEDNFMVSRADVLGDSRQEAILHGSRGICIYNNSALLPQPSLYNATLYPGM